MSQQNTPPDIRKVLHQHGEDIRQLKRRRLPATPTGNTVPDSNAGITGASFARYGFTHFGATANTINQEQFQRLDVGEPDIFDAAGFGPQTLRYSGLWSIQMHCSIDAHNGDVGQIDWAMLAVVPAEVFTGRYPSAHATAPLTPNFNTSGGITSPTVQLSIIAWLPRGTNIVISETFGASGPRDVGVDGYMCLMGLPGS